MPYPYLLDWPAASITRLFVLPNAPWPWDDSHAERETQSLYGNEALLDALTEDRPYPRRNATVYERDGAGWRHWTRGGVEPCGAADVWLHYALSLQAAERAVWVGRDGRRFEHPRGHYGMVHPSAEIGLRHESGDLRWLVIGQRVPDRYPTAGLWCMLFDTLTDGADGYPHPAGLWRVT